MNILEISQNIIEVLKKISNSPTGVTFVSLDYTAKSSGERAKHLINVGASLENAKKKDIEALSKISIGEIVEEIKEKYGKAKEKENVDHNYKVLNSFCGEDKTKQTEEIKKAIEAILKSLKNPSKNRSEGQKNAYVQICTGFKECIASGDIHIYGMSVSKTVITKGEYKQVKSRLQTLLKNHVKKNHMKSTKFRNYIIKNAESVK